MGNFLKFHEMNTINKDVYKDTLLVLAYISESADSLNEEELTEASILAGLTDKLGDVLPKAGLKLHKGKGLLSYVKDFTGTAGKMIIAAIKKDKEQIKKLSQEFEKADFIDFLLKLDMVTMHLVTGPIHMVDAVTGWDLMANLKAHTKKAEDTLETIQKAIADLKAKVAKIADEKVVSPIIAFFDSIGELLYGDLMDKGE